jgi:hypothetical protein
MLGRNGFLLFIAWSITAFRGQRKILVRAG